jgi:2-polyprenyl-3-methyl-5-hydroxy-6-metoxy-1,4-benzoquinol methylase
MTRTIDEQKREIQMLARLVDLRDQRVLDIGCGDGRLAVLMAELAASVVGIDPDEEAITQARRAASSSVSFLVAGVNDVTLPSSAFDVVVFSRSL